MIPEYGSKLQVKDAKDIPNVEELVLIKERLLENLEGNFWTFDQWGNITSPAKEGELPFDYFIEGKYYIEIRNYNINQDNFVPLTAYMFNIFQHGKQYDQYKGFLTNNIAYMDIRDCLDAARWIIYSHKQELELYYNSDDHTTSDFKNVIIGEEGAMSINPNIQIDLIPTDVLDENLLENLTYIPERKPDFVKPIDHPRFYKHNPKRTAYVSRSRKKM